MTHDQDLQATNAVESLELAQGSPSTNYIVDSMDYECQHRLSILL